MFAYLGIVLCHDGNPNPDLCLIIANWYWEGRDLVDSDLVDSGQSRMKK